MRTRNVVAASTLVGLLGIPLLGQSAYVTPPLAHWAIFWGMSPLETAFFVAVTAATCVPIGGVGGIVCGMVGAG